MSPWQSTFKYPHCGLSSQDKTLSLRLLKLHETTPHALISSHGHLWAQAGWWPMVSPHSAMSWANENAPGSSQQDQVPLQWWCLCPILLNLQLERPIKCMPVSKILLSRVIIKIFIVVPASLWNEWEKRRDRLHFYFYFPFLFVLRKLLSRNGSLETPRRNIQPNPLLVHTRELYSF